MVNSDDYRYGITRPLRLSTRPDRQPLGLPEGFQDAFHPRYAVLSKQVWPDACRENQTLPGRRRPTAFL